MRADRVIAVRGDRIVCQVGSLCLKRYSRPDGRMCALQEALNLTRAEMAGVRVPRLIEVKEIDGQWAFVTEYIRGGTLQARIESGRMTPEEGMALLLRIQRDLLAHDLDGECLCHGDLTPENILLSEDAAIYILDWESAAQGSAGMDMARTWLRLMLNERETWARAYMDALSASERSQARECLPTAAAALWPMCNRRERGILFALREKWMRNEESE